MDGSCFCTQSTSLWFLMSELRLLIFRVIIETCIWVYFYTQSENFLPGFSVKLS